jgi:phosphoglycolate phosphatase-like HAD superfamily hydrolase
VTVQRADVAFLLDVDNTLLDNGVVVADLRRQFRETLGTDAERRYWEIFEELFRDPGFADYLGALQRYSLEHPRDPRLFEIALFLLNYPFAERLYPHAIEVIAALQSRGPVAIVSDGDVVFQPYKVKRSGLWDAAAGRVLIYIHKETMLDDIERCCPARRYVMVDDKIYILAAIKAIWTERVTTVFVRQGHYALDKALVAASPPADVTVDSIGDLIELAHLL